MRVSQIIADALKFEMDNETDSEISHVIERTVLEAYTENDLSELDSEEFEIMVITLFDGKVPPIVDVWLEQIGDEPCQLLPGGIVDDLLDGI